MKESITKFDLEAAFKALDEIEAPKVGSVKANRPALNEIFSRKTKFDALMEEYYDVSSMDELDDAKDAREAEVAQAKLARIEKIVDLDAESPEDLLPSYVGKFIMQCPQCMTLFYKNPEDIEASEEDPDVVNVAEVCQHCGNESGYTLIGKVGAATEEEMSEYTQEETVDVTSTDDGEEALTVDDEIPTDESDEELDLELDELDLDIEDDEEEKTEESFTGHGGDTLVEELHEDVGADVVHNTQKLINDLLGNDAQATRDVINTVIDAIPDEELDNVVSELKNSVSSAKLAQADIDELGAAAGEAVPEDADTIGKVLEYLDAFEWAKKSPELLKAILNIGIRVISVIEPSFAGESVNAVIATLPADIVAKIAAAVSLIGNPIGAAVHGANQLHKRSKTKSITEDTNDMDVSADEFEKLISSPEFKKSISDSDARAMIDELSDTKDIEEAFSVIDEDDVLSDRIEDMMHTGNFMQASWIKDAPTVEHVGNNTYRVTHNLGSTSVTVKFDTSNTHDCTLKFTVDGKPFATKYVNEAQTFVIQELEAARVKSFDLALDEGIFKSKKDKQQTVDTEPKAKYANNYYVVIANHPSGRYTYVQGMPPKESKEAAEADSKYIERNSKVEHQIVTYKDARKLVGRPFKESVTSNDLEAESLEEGILDKLKDKFPDTVDNITTKLKSREAKADWLLANTMKEYNDIEVDTNGRMVPDKNNQKFNTFVVIGFTSRDNKGNLIKSAPDYDDENLVVGKNGVQYKDKYEAADKIAKGWSMRQGNGPAFIYLAKGQDDDNALFLCEYFMGQLKNDQLEKYIKLVKNELKGAKLMADGGMSTEDDSQTDADSSAEATTEGLESVMTDVEELQEVALEKLISDSLVEAYGNVAGFRLVECGYENKKFTVDGTIYFTSGNKRRTSYMFNEALNNNGKVSMRGLNEKLGLDKQFTIVGRTDNKTFITESFKATKK
jgi:hypothetical protein